MANIVKCTIKKSISVSIKLLKWGTVVGIILAIVAGIVFGIISIWDNLVTMWNEYITWSLSILTPIEDFFTEIPWFVYVIIAIPTCVVVYSYLWCWNRQNPDKIKNFVYTHSEVPISIFGGVIGGILIGLMVMVTEVEEVLGVSSFICGAITTICIFMGTLGGIYCLNKIGL